MDQIVFIKASGTTSASGRPLAEIFRMNGDGSGVENLTRAPNEYRELGLSPDGRTLIFEANRQTGESTLENCRAQVWTMATDGSELKQVTSGRCAQFPRVSPDGTRIAYVRVFGIGVSNIDGTNPREPSPTSPPAGSICSSSGTAWGILSLEWISLSRIAFQIYCGAGKSSFVLDLNDGSVSALGFDEDRAWLSSDGTRIAYGMPGLGDLVRLATMKVDGSGVRTFSGGGLLPSRLRRERNPWSPDGKRVYFRTLSFWDGHAVARVDDTGIRHLVMPPFEASFGGWSPHGDWILLSVFSSSSRDLYIMKADGSRLVNLTNNSGVYHDARWVPRR